MSKIENTKLDHAQTESQRSSAETQRAVGGQTRGFGARRGAFFGLGGFPL